MLEDPTTTEKLLNPLETIHNHPEKGWPKSVMGYTGFYVARGR